ncbi:MAG: hypothetical protein D6B27_03130 [Gammaproteobacteria bacterium]|nr:MAG: hypothetical protein D6B27_03130 [Gammaproteobacteria bacterium]
MVILSIARHELKKYFKSPLGWSALAIVTAVASYMFIEYLVLYVDKYQPQMHKYTNPPGVTDLVIVHTIAFISEFYMWIIPIIAMNIFADEKKNGTLGLLQSSPISAAEMVVGKYLGIVGFLLVILMLLFSMLILLRFDVELDLGVLFSGIISLFLLLSLWAAATMYFSTLTKTPIIAAIIAFALIRFFWELDIDVSSYPDTELNRAIGKVLYYASTPQRFGTMIKGIIRTSDISYFVIFTAAFILLSIRRFDAERLRY